MGEPTTSIATVSVVGRAHCFGLFMVHSTFVTLVIVDLLLLSHTIIFTITNFATGELRYSDGNTILAALVPFGMFVPLMLVEFIWLITCLLSIVSLKTVLPYLQLPYLLSAPLVLTTMIWLIVRLVELLLRFQTLEWPLVVVLAAVNLLLIEQCYFFYVKLSCFKMLIRKRKLVSITEHPTTPKVNTAAPDCQFDTYSTQSTIIVTDDYLNRQQPEAA